MKTNKIIIFLSVVLFSSNLLAGSIKTGNPVRERSNKQSFSDGFYKKFEKYQEMIADEKLVEARSGLNALAQRRMNKYEEASVNQFLGWIDSMEEKYVSAANRFEAALNADSLPNQAQFSMMLQVASLYMSGGKYQKGLDAMHKYYKITDEITDQTFTMEANAYAQLEQYRKAIPILKKAIGLSEKPKEQWNYLLYSMHMSLSQYNEAAKVLETLIAINPNKKDYWMRLNGVYFNLKKDKKALAVLVLADKNGLLTTEKDRMQLFKMYAFLEVPYKAGSVLESGLKSGIIKPSFKKWDDLGSVWYRAAEMDRALSAFDEASKLATDGKIDFRRANIYFDKEQYQKAKDALLSAIEKGGLKDSKMGTAWLLIGMAESELGNNQGAVKALKKSSKYEKTRKYANQWIDHIKTQQTQARERAEREKLLEEDEANKMEES